MSRLSYVRCLTVHKAWRKAADGGASCHRLRVRGVGDDTRARDESTHMLPRYDAQALWLSQSLTVTWLDQHIPTAPSALTAAAHRQRPRSDSWHHAMIYLTTSMPEQDRCVRQSRNKRSADLACDRSLESVGEPVEDFPAIASTEISTTAPIAQLMVADRLSKDTAHWSACARTNPPCEELLPQPRQQRTRSSILRAAYQTASFAPTIPAHEFGRGILAREELVQVLEVVLSQNFLEHCHALSNVKHPVEARSLNSRNQVSVWAGSRD